MSVRLGYGDNYTALQATTSSSGNYSETADIHEKFQYAAEEPLDWLSNENISYSLSHKFPQAPPRAAV